MLILTRRLGEEIMIGDDIIVTVNRIRESQVQIGIRAPKTVPVHRREIYVKIQRQEAVAG